MKFLVSARMNRLTFDYILTKLADFWLEENLDLVTEKDDLLFYHDKTSDMLKMFFALDPSGRTESEIHKVANSLTEKLKKLLSKFTDQIEVSVMEENGMQIQAC